MFTENFSLTGLTGTFTRQGVIRTIRYDEGTATGGVAPTLRITSLQGSKVDFEMKPGRIINLTEPLNGIVIKNASTGANITGKISYGDGQVTDNTTTGSVDLNSNTITALVSAMYTVRPEIATASWADASATTVNTPFTLVAPGTNTNGILLLSAGMTDSVANACVQTFIAKISAPVSIIDGRVLAMSKAMSVPANALIQGELQAPVLIPAGQGLYFMPGATNAASAYTARFASWKLL